MTGHELRQRVSDAPDNFFMLRPENDFLVECMRRLQLENLAIADRMTDAIENGNQWHDNAEYDSTLAEMEIIDRTSSALGPMISNAVILEPPSTDEPEVFVGSRVKIEDDGGAFEAYIVGQSAFLPKHADRFSFEPASLRSPLGLALIGKTAGSEVVYEPLPGREFKVVIAAVDQVQPDDFWRIQ